jgi:hypothetical protein
LTPPEGGSKNRQILCSVPRDVSHSHAHRFSVHLTEKMLRVIDRKNSVTHHHGDVITKIFSGEHDHDRGQGHTNTHHRPFRTMSVVLCRGRPLRGHLASRGALLGRWGNGQNHRPAKRVLLHTTRGWLASRYVKSIDLTRKATRFISIFHTHRYNRSEVRALTLSSCHCPPYARVLSVMSAHHTMHQLAPRSHGLLFVWRRLLYTSLTTALLPRVCCFFSAAPAEPVGPWSDSKNFTRTKFRSSLLGVIHSLRKRFIYPLLEGV